jgi:hypothetical protein
MFCNRRVDVARTFIKIMFMKAFIGASASGVILISVLACMSQFIDILCH